MDINEPSPTFGSLQRHNKYYIPSADLSILVENIQFRVHRYFFDRESLYFKTRLLTPASPIAPSPGSSDSTAFILEDVKASEFARFLWVFYNPRYSLYDEATLDDWQSILQLSHRWLFPEVKSLAVRELQKKPMLPVKRIKLYHDTNVDRNLLIPEYSALCERGEPLTLEEGLDLGMETTLMIARGREEIRSTRSPNGLRSPLTPTFHGADLHDVIKELFKIEPWSPEDNAVLSPTGGEPVSSPVNANFPPASKNPTNTQLPGGSPTKPPVTQPQTPQQKPIKNKKTNDDPKENPTVPPTPTTSSEKKNENEPEGGQGTKPVAGQRGTQNSESKKKPKKPKKNENGMGAGANGDDAGASQNKGASNVDTTKPKDGGGVNVNATTTNDQSSSPPLKDNQKPTIITTAVDNLNGIEEDPKSENAIENGEKTGADTYSYSDVKLVPELSGSVDPLGVLDTQLENSAKTPKSPGLFSSVFSSFSKDPIPYATGNTNVA